MNSAMSEDVIRSDWVGRVIDGRFPLQLWLGGSGRTGVFQTEMPGTPPRKAAIKLVQADAEDADAIAAGWSASIDLTHAHLVRLFHTGRCRIDGMELIYAVTEFADEVLAEILMERALTPDETTEMLDPVVDTLSWLHGKGLVHGRLKPSNILVVDDQLKLSGDSIHQSGQPGMNSPAPGIYAAPEVAAGLMNPAADVWSLGVTLVEALTQRRPTWDGASPEAVSPVPLPQPFAGIARACLQADPAGRCSLADVRNWLHKPEAPSEPAAEVAEPTGSGKTRNAVLIGVAIALLAGGGGYAVYSHQSQPAEPAAEEVQQPPASAPVETQDQPQTSAAKPSPSQAQVSAPPQQAPAPAAQASAVASQPAPVPTRAVSPSNGAILNQVMPDLLPAAVQSIHGRVNIKVRVSVAPSGNVSDAVLESEGSSRYFSKAALEAARQWKFKTAESGGQPVPSSWILDFKFTQDGAEVAPSPAQ
jgi:TonB family protein